MANHDAVMQSYGRCCKDERFFEDFYDRFLSSSSAIQEKFKNTDMPNQRKLLRQGIMNLVLYARGMPDTKLRQLGRTHSRTGFDIRPEYYGLWVSALLDTIRRHDPQHTESLEREWRDVLNKGIAVITSLY